MADQHIDIERMIMQARYEMQLEAEASSAKSGLLSDMEREQYQNQIKDLLQAVETLLKSNRAMGERMAQLEKIAQDYEGKAAICKADVEECPSIAAQYRIRNVPTVLFFKNGEPKDKSVGLVQKSTLTEKIDALL